jgi:two-component system LytT family response regulator
MTLRCLLVDDEPLARDRLRAMLGAHADVEVLGECEDAAAAVAAIRALRPDVVFLDVQMPGADGFDVIDAAQVTPAPFVVFATAHARHAVRAFDAGAGDYLLKPYDDGRLSRALRRAREALAARGARGLAEEVRSLVEALGAEDVRVPAPAVAASPRYLQRLAVTVGPRTRLVRVPEIDWVEASGNYVALHVGAQQYLVRLALTALEQRLDPAAFARIHRSALVQIDRVRELRAVGNGDYKVVLADGTVLPMTQRYRERLREA